MQTPRGSGDRGPVPQIPPLPDTDPPSQCFPPRDLVRVTRVPDSLRGSDWDGTTVRASGSEGDRSESSLPLRKDGKTLGDSPRDSRRAHFNHPRRVKLGVKNTWHLGSVKSHQCSCIKCSIGPSQFRVQDPGPNRLSGVHWVRSSMSPWQDGRRSLTWCDP